MKKSYILSAMLLALTATTMLPSFAFAEDSATIQATNQPSKAALAAKIAEVKALENYTEYSALSNDLLEYVTDYASDYRYLFNLVFVAESMLGNYDQISPNDLNMIMSAADEAIISCNLKFGVTKRQADEAKAQAQAQAQANAAQNVTQNETPTAPAPIISAPKAPVTTTGAVASTVETPKTETPTVISETTVDSDKVKPATEETAPVEIPATGETTEQKGALDSHPLAFIIITVAGLGIILALIINSRQKTHRPGRKA